MRLSKTLLIAVIVLGAASLVYWAKLVKNYETPAEPAKIAASAAVERQSENTSTPAVPVPASPPEQSTATSSNTTPSAQSTALKPPPQNSSTSASGEPIPLSEGVEKML